MPSIAKKSSKNSPIDPATLRGAIDATDLLHEVAEEIDVVRAACMSTGGDAGVLADKIAGVLIRTGAKVERAREAVEALTVQTRARA